MASPSRTDINFASLDLEPLQATMANFGNEFDTLTVVVDGVFDGMVYEPLNDGLQAVGFGSQTPAQVASVVQAAFIAWQATQD